MITPKKGALSDVKREKRFEEISVRRLELKLTEEACICAAEQQGQFVTRRREADARAILEVSEA